MVKNDVLYKTTVSGKNIYQRAWNHFCWLQEGKDISIYSNGHLVSKFKENVDTKTNYLFMDQKDVFDSALILGQDQGTVKGGFSLRKLFQGKLTEFNIWNKILPTNEIIRMSRCEIFPKGNIIVWKKENFKLNKVIHQDTENLCKRKVFFIFPKRVKLSEASRECRVLGGEVAAPVTEEENKEIVDLTKLFPSQCMTFSNSVSWIGVERISKYGGWTQTGNASKIATFNKLGKKYMKSLEDDAENVCITLTEKGDWKAYHDCNASANVIKACNICQFSRVPSLLVRGLCTPQGPNWIYYLVQDQKSGYYFEGYKRDKIIQTEDSWELITSDKQKFVTLKPFTGGPVGRRVWKQHRAMDEACGQTEYSVLDDYNMYLEDHEQSQLDFSLITFSICSLLEEFSCNNGECIEKYKRCDEIVDCSDGSDEQFCSVVEVPDDYRSGEPPKLQNGKINNVNTTIQIKRFDNIALDGTMEITINIEMTWIDERLTFLNIIDDNHSGTASIKDVSKSKQTKIWLPLDRIVHENAVIGEVKVGSANFVRVVASTEALESHVENAIEGKSNIRFLISYPF